MNDSQIVYVLVGAAGALAEEQVFTTRALAREYRTEMQFESSVKVRRAKLTIYGS